MNLEEITTTVAESYHEGRRVVRLHTGDPSLYGAIFEQMAELKKRSIPYRVIPGITAAFAAAAAMDLEYTLPEVSQTLILTRMAGRTPVPESESLERLARHQASMVIYLSMGLIDKVARILAGAYGEACPCAVAFRVSQPDEKIIRTTVGELVESVRVAGITRQAVIVVGRVMAVTADSLVHKSRLYDKAFSHGFRKPHVK